MEKKPSVFRDDVWTYLWDLLYFIQNFNKSDESAKFTGFRQNRGKRGGGVGEEGKQDYINVFIGKYIVVLFMRDQNIITNLYTTETNICIYVGQFHIENIQL